MLCGTICGISIFVLLPHAVCSSKISFLRPYPQKTMGHQQGRHIGLPLQLASIFTINHETLRTVHPESLV